MNRYAMAFVLSALTALPVAAKVLRFPAGFHFESVPTDGATIYARTGGTGPAVVLLHGFGDTGDMRAPLAAKLGKDHTVIVPDLRGMGLSSHPDSGYDRKKQRHDIAAVLNRPPIASAALL